MREQKYIITYKNGKLRHFKSDWLHHQTIARDNGYSEREIIEAGVLLDGKPFIFDCVERRHKERRRDRLIGDRAVDLSFNVRSYLKARQVESLYFYGIVREGD